MADLRTIILDVDGTLVDSNDAHAHAWIDSLNEAGYNEVQFEQVRRLIGMGGDKLLPQVVEGLSTDSDEGKRISERRGEIFLAQYLPKLKAFVGVRQLVERFKEDGFKVVIASSAKRKELDPLLKVAGIDDLLEETTSSDDAEESKPDPDIIQAALKKSGASAAEAMMIGDTPYDVEASLKAGVQVIGVRCGGWGDVDLHGAIAVYDNPADLLARYHTSPLRKSVRT
jgi:HAD superfamily hydrolase (TIGR01509 family)